MTLRYLGVSGALLICLCLCAVASAPASAACLDEQARSERNSIALPDCRAYELVTPPNKNGATIGGQFLSSPPAIIAANGQRVMAATNQCFGGARSCSAVRVSEGEPLSFARTSDGWITHELAPPASRYETSSWFSLNADLGTALFLAPNGPESEVDDWLAVGGDGSKLVSLGPLGEHAAPIEKTPPNWRALSVGVIPVTATADLSHVVYETTEPMFSGDKSSRSPVYEYVGPSSAPLLVNLSGGFASTGQVSSCSEIGGGSSALARINGSLSADGRVVYFTATKASSACPVGPAAQQLYARVDGELPNARTSLISAPTPGVCTTTVCQESTSAANEATLQRAAYFESASTDGSDVFFTDTQQLTNAASESEGSAASGQCQELATPGGCNLYESECPHCQVLSEGQEHGARHLVDVSEADGGGEAPGGPRVQGVVATAPDGSHIYFVARGVLTGAEANAAGETAQDGQANLYLYSEGRRSFIATFGALDESAGGSLESIRRQWGVFAPRDSVTPEGRYLLFASHRALTPDVTRVEGPEQLYRYDALTRRLVRVSIGEEGYNDNGNTGEGAATLAAPFREPSGGSTSSRTDPSMSDDGEYVFFQSPIALIAGALNDVPIGSNEGVALDEGFAQNIYEWHGGHISLISDGKDVTPTPGALNGKVSPVELLGTDSTGSNVFFETYDRLVPEDSDSARDIYDAHVCSEAQPCSAPNVEPASVCGEASCHGLGPVPAGSASPVSELFAGPGNPAPAAPAKPGKAKPATRAQLLAVALHKCRRERVRRRRRACEKLVRKRYRPPGKTSRAARRRPNSARHATSARGKA